MSESKASRHKKNIFYWSDGEEYRAIRSALKKESGKNPDLATSYAPFFALTPKNENPYEDLDLSMDIRSFAETLPPNLQEVFALYLERFTPDEIIEATGRHYRAVYRDLVTIKRLFKEFYLEEEE